MIRKKIALIAVTLFIISCKTYTVSTDSLKKQFANTSSTNLKEIKIERPFFGSTTYYANNIGMIDVVDKKGNQKYIYNTPSIEMRITHKNGRKYYFYFDTTILENDTIKGGRSRFLPKLKREIPFDSIAKIEIQDGGKKFN